MKYMRSIYYFLLYLIQSLFSFLVCKEDICYNSCMLKLKLIVNEKYIYPSKKNCKKCKKIGTPHKLPEGQSHLFPVDPFIALNHKCLLPVTMATHPASHKSERPRFVGLHTSALREMSRGFAFCTLSSSSRDEQLHSMPLNSSDDNRTTSVFTSKLTPAADICVGLTILSFGKCTSVL